MIIHAGCLSLWTRRLGWRGVLVLGDSASGKSDLALRMLDLGLRLVSDDRTVVWRSGGRLFAACPAAIEGLVEARGVGVLAEASLRLTPVVLAVRCVPETQRLPDAEITEVAGGPVPLLRLAALEASAPAKLRRAIQSLGAGPQGAYLAAAENPHGGVPVKGRV